MKLKYIYLAIISLTLCLFGCVESQKVVIAKSGIHYVKPPTSKGVIQGEKVKYQLWYDKDKWEVVTKEHPQYKDIKALLKNERRINISFLINKSQEVVCYVQEDRIPSSFKTISDVMHSRGNVLNEEIRKVNGQYVLFIKSSSKEEMSKNHATYKAAKDKLKAFGMNEESIDDLLKDVYAPLIRIGFTYYLTNKYGTVTVSAVMSDTLISEYESHIFDLLNGLVAPSLETPPPTAVEKQTDEDIESKLIKLKNMKDKGLITQEDYDKSKNKLLNKY